MVVAFDFDAVIPTVLDARKRRQDVPRISDDRTSERPACVVLTGDAKVRGRLEAAAELAGWDTGLGPNDAASFLSGFRRDPRLVVVDLVTPADADPDSLEALGRQVATNPHLLLVVCGAGDDVDHERWARSHGAFVHVPGLSSGDSIVAVFREARGVADRLSTRRLRGRQAAAR